MIEKLNNEKMITDKVVRNNTQIKMAETVTEDLA